MFTWCFDVLDQHLLCFATFHLILNSSKIFCIMKGLAKGEKMWDGGGEGIPKKCVISFFNIPLALKPTVVHSNNFHITLNIIMPMYCGKALCIVYYDLMKYFQEEANEKIKVYSVVLILVSNIIWKYVSLILFSLHCAIYSRIFFLRNSHFFFLAHPYFELPYFLLYLPLSWCFFLSIAPN